MGTGGDIFSDVDLRRGKLLHIKCELLVVGRVTPCIFCSDKTGIVRDCNCSDRHIFIGNIGYVAQGIRECTCSFLDIYCELLRALGHIHLVQRSSSVDFYYAIVYIAQFTSLMRVVTRGGPVAICANIIIVYAINQKSHLRVAE